jgi:hypothetical protein
MIKAGHITLCIFNCGFSANFQRCTSHQILVYFERETARNPQYKHTVYRYCDTKSYYIIVLQSVTID